MNKRPKFNLTVKSYLILISVLIMHRCTGRDMVWDIFIDVSPMNIRNAEMYSNTK